MNRRSFLQTSISTLVVGNAAFQGCRTTSDLTSQPALSAASSACNQTLASKTRINLKPVMTNMIHTGV